MSLNWDEAAEFEGRDRDGKKVTGLTVTLTYNNVLFNVVHKDDYWIVDVSILGVEVWSDDEAKESSEDSAKLRAEKVYRDQAASWCNADMLAELLKHK